MCMTVDYLYIYIYIHICIYMFMILDGHWQSVYVSVCLFHNHDTCCLNYSMFFCSDLPPPPGFNLSMTTVCMCVCLGSVIMILVV